MLVEDRIDVGSEPRTVEDWSAREEGDGCVGAHEPTLPKRRQLADRDAVAGDDECLAAVERAHDLAAFVPKLSLADLSRHIRKRSTRATECSAGGRQAARTRTSAGSAGDPSILLGGAIMTLELPTAFPYFAVIAADAWAGSR